MSDSEVDTERTVVRTYVPAYQRDEWDDHAEELDMSRSEFVRTMVQAGRREFGAQVDSVGATDTGAEESDRDDADSNQESSAGAIQQADLERRVVETLADGEFLTWEELVTELTDDIEQRLEDTLADLQSDGTVRYSGRNGGYTLNEQ